MQQHTDPEAVTAQARTQWNTQPELRAEFGNDFERFAAFEKARVRGGARIVKATTVKASADDVRLTVAKLRGVRLAFDVDFTTASPFRFSASDEGRIGGVLVTYNTVNRRRLRLAPGVFAGTLDVPKPLLFAHRDVIGKWTRLADGPHELFGEAELNRNTDAGSVAYEHLRAGDVAGLSVGFAVPDEPGAVGEGKDGIVTIFRGELLEASVVVAGADRGALVDSVR
jgi:HK97 family phage prohead protease